jgi:uncharacterized RDD family membrane protein YckC
MYCTKCGAVVDGTFCTKCGTLANPQPASAAPFPPPPPPPFGYSAPAPVLADVGARIGAFVIDVVPILILGVIFRRIPFLGRIIMGFISAAYWLLRDFNGASLGKMTLGLFVVKKNGAPASTNERIMRNLTLAIGPALQIIPLLGWLIAVPLTFVLAVTELVVLIVKHERLGDMLAGTTVIKRPT